MQCCALKLTFILNLLPDAVNIFFLCQKDRQLKFLFCLQSIRKENKVLSDHSYKNARRTQSKVYFIAHSSCTQHKIVVADNFLRNKRYLIPVVLMYFFKEGMTCLHVYTRRRGHEDGPQFYDVEILPA